MSQELTAEEFRRLADQIEQKAKIIRDLSYVMDKHKIGTLTLILPKLLRGIALIDYWLKSQFVLKLDREIRRRGGAGGLDPQYWPKPEK